MLPYLWCEQLSEQYCSVNNCGWCNATCMNLCHSECTDTADVCNLYDDEWLIGLIPFSIVSVLVLLFVGFLIEKHETIHREVWWGWSISMILLVGLSILFAFIQPWIATVIINLGFGFPLISFFLSRLVVRRADFSFYHALITISLTALLGTEILYYGFVASHTSYWVPLVLIYSTLLLLYIIWVEVIHKVRTLLVLICIIQYTGFAAIAVSSQGDARYLWLSNCCFWALVSLVHNLWTYISDQPKMLVASYVGLVGFLGLTVFQGPIWIYFNVWYFLTMTVFATHLVLVGWPGLTAMVQYDPSYIYLNV